jgi:hypothetical protein
MKTLIDELVRQIQNSQETSKILNTDYLNKIDEILKKISTELEMEGVKNYIKHDLIYVPMNKYHELTISLCKESASISITNHARPDTLTSGKQVNIFKVLSTLEEELTDLQISLWQLEKLDDWKSRNNLMNLITDDFFNQLLETGKLEPFHNITLSMTKTNKGRYNYINQFGDVKSYHKDQVKAKLCEYAGRYAEYLLSNLTTSN